MTTLAQARRAIRDRILTLEPTDAYAWGDSDRWHETLAPSTEGLDQQGGGDAHLAFFADDSVSDRTFFARGNAREGTVVTIPMAIRFLFQLRPASQVDDWDACADAAHALATHLVDWADPPIDVSVLLATPILERQVDPRTGWVEAALSVDVVFCLSLSAS